jgi:hypothetical protein
MTVRCRKCGVPYEPDSNFCDQCGEPLRAPQLEPTRKIPDLVRRPLFGLYASGFLIVIFISLLVSNPFSHRMKQYPAPAKNAKWEAAMRLVHDLRNSDPRIAQQAADKLASSLLNSAPNSHVRQYMDLFLKDLVSADPATRRSAITSLEVLFDPADRANDPLVIGPLIEGLGNDDPIIRYFSLLGLRLHWLKATHEQIASYVIDQLQRGLPPGSPITPGMDKDMLSLYQAAGHLGIEYPFFFSHDTLKEIILNRNQIDRRPVAVIVMMRGNPKTKSGLLPFQNGPLFNSLTRQGYAVMVYEASSDLDIAKAIEQATREKKASFLLLYGHANQRAQFFGDNRNHPLDKDSLGRLKPKELWRHFELGSQALLIGCNSGQGGANEENVANYLRQLFPRPVMASIMAPTDILFVPDHLLFDHQGRLLKFLPGDHVPSLYEA